MKTPSVAELKKMAKEREHVLLSQSAYNELKARALPEYIPTAAEQRAILHSQRNFKAGKGVPLVEALRALER